MKHRPEAILPQPNDSGWFPLPRNPKVAWLWKDPEIFRAWAWLYRTAARRDGESAVFRTARITLEVGQIAVTYQGLGLVHGWSRTRVRNFLRTLEIDQEISVRPKSYDRKTDTWKDSKTDSGILLLTLLQHPFRKPSPAKETGEETGKRTGVDEKGQEKDRKETVKKTPERTAERTGAEAPVSIGATHPEASRKDRDSDSEKDTSGDTPPPEKKTGLNTQQQYPEPSVSSSERGVRGENEPPCASPPGDGLGGTRGPRLLPPSPEPFVALHRLDLLSRVNKRRCLELLETIGILAPEAIEISEQLPIGRVFDVVHTARTKSKPSGWAMRAFQRGWPAARPEGEVLEAFIVLLEADKAREGEPARDPPLRSKVPRLPGEDETAWLKRVQTFARKAKEVNG